MQSLFDAFDIPVQEPLDVPAFLQRPSEPVSQADLLAELHRLEESQQVIRSYLQHFDHTKLNPIYLNYIIQHYHTTGEFAHICARCYKPILNHKKVTLAYGLLFGVECFSRIQKRQEALKWRYLASGLRQLPTEGELETFRCETTGYEFKALPDNVVHCGSHIKSCASCPSSAVRFKGRPCPFEAHLASLTPAGK